jgi:primosomal protein N' (replication factor Y)
VVVGFSSLLDKPCREAARKFAEMLSANAQKSEKNVPLRILGPAPNTIERLNGRFRYRLLVKCKNGRALREVFEKTLKAAYSDSAFANVSFYADINGNIE